MPEPELNLKRLSKTVSRALRHAPQDFGLTLDPEGWVEVDLLLDALRVRRAFAGVVAADLERMMDAATKRRFEIEGGRIRARYGHSVENQPRREAGVPPAVLYHGTDPAVVGAILAEGLKPMGRQRVHLSTDVETATRVGQRKVARPVILQVDAAAAHAAGVVFEEGGDETWLTALVPGEFVKAPEGDAA